MPIGFRVGIILVCAYAGWQTASVQFGELPEPQQRTYQAGVDVRRESAHVRLLTSSACALRLVPLPTSSTERPLLAQSGRSAESIS